MLFWDTHCHLNEPCLASEMDSIIADANKAGVHHIVVPSFNQDSLKTTRDLYACYPEMIYPGAGLHPWYVGSKSDIQWIESAFEVWEWSCVGEIGLDFSPGLPDPGMQEWFLAAQLDLARRHKLPVSLHCRKAHHRLLEILSRDANDLTIVFHAFNGSWELARQLMKMNVFFSFCGTLTYENARKLIETGRQVPDDRMLLETDAPSIALNSIPAESVRPVHVVEVARTLAVIRKTSIEHIARVTSENASRIFKKPL